MKKVRKPKICYVLSHKRPNYVRTDVLLRVLKNLDGYELIDCRNTIRSVFRYIETIIRLIWIRLTQNPDIYLLGFRAQDIYFSVRFLTMGKPLIVDEFVVAYDSVIFEGKFEGKGLSFSENGLVAKILYTYEKLMLKSANYILTDTQLHRRLIVDTFDIDKDRIKAIPVGTIEEFFNDDNAAEIKIFNPSRSGASFKIFYYGDIMKLHGFDVILKAAKKLKTFPIKFTLGVGRKVQYAQEQIKRVFGKEVPHNIEIVGWINGYDKIIDYMNDAHLCISGPFGATGQAMRVIHGKTYQYLALGRPTVIGQIPYNYGFQHKINCLYVEQGNPDALAEAILWAYNHPRKLKKIGRNARRLYKERFSNEQIAEELIEVFEELDN